MLRRINQEDIKTAVAHAGATYSQSEAITWLAIDLALGLAPLLGWRLTVSMIRPIAAAVSAAMTIANGDLTQSLYTRGQDAAAQLVHAR